MSIHRKATLPCPHCRAEAQVIVQQIVAAHDLLVKAAFVQGHSHAARCPHCGGVIAQTIPTLYYDQAQSLAFVFVPGDPTAKAAQERTIKELTAALRGSVLPEQLAPALLRPRRFASLTAMVKAVLAADGISAEMLEAQVARAELIATLLGSPSEEALREQALAQAEALDPAFFELLTAHMQAAQLEGDQERAQTLLSLRTYLGHLTPQATQAIAEIDAKLGLSVIQSREALLDQLRRADTQAERAALVASGHVLLDPSFFQQLDAAAEAQPETAQELHALRRELLELKAAHTAEHQAALDRAADLFRQVVQADTPDTALKRNLDSLDEAFFVLLGANIERARRQGQQEPALAMEQIGRLARTLLQERAA